jgi:hypothetical protein
LLITASVEGGSVSSQFASYWPCSKSSSEIRWQHFSSRGPVSLTPDLLPIAPLLVEVPRAAGVDDPLPLAPVALGALLLLVEFLALRLQSGQDIEQVGLFRLGRYKVLKRILQDRPTVCFCQKKKN